jgi:glycosyltransferase involved in cell wall biosynthesis
MVPHRKLAERAFGSGGHNMKVEARASVNADTPAPITTSESISIVIPLYNEEGSLETLYQELTDTLTPLGQPYEIIFVNDGSTDGSSEALSRICRSDPNVKALHLRRNFGKAAGLTEGFNEATGEIIFTMDADLQDDPKEIPSFLAKLAEGYDLVSGWKFHRLDPLSKTLPSKLFNKVASKTTGVQLHDFNCGFKAYRREVLEHINVYGELHRYIPALAHGNGFKVAEIPIHHRARQFGKSKYGMARFTRGLLDLLTVLFITRYMKKPLHLFGSLGLILLFMGVGVNIYLTTVWLAGHPIGRRPLLMLGVLLMILGVQFISHGLLAEMMAHYQKADKSLVSRRVGNPNKLRNTDTSGTVDPKAWI